MRLPLIIFVIGLIATGLFSCGQYKSPPSYLTEQAFPDSVLQMSLTTSGGSATTFGEVLSKHKGKKIILDFWAAWCGDCIKGLPNFKRLMKQFPNVGYVMISVDENPVKWKTTIKKFDIPGDHYLSQSGWENKLTDYISLDYIPRYVVLSEDGKVILPKATSSTDEELMNLLTE